MKQSRIATLFTHSIPASLMQLSDELLKVTLQKSAWGPNKKLTTIVINKTFSKNSGSMPLEVYCNAVSIGFTRFLILYSISSEVKDDNFYYQITKTENTGVT